MKNMRPMIVQLSNKQEVKITSDELESISEGINTGSMIKLRQGIVNPSFIVSVVPDLEVWNEHLNGLYPGDLDHEGKQKERQRRIEEGVPAYKDQFDLSAEIKKLSTSKNMRINK